MLRPMRTSLALLTVLFCTSFAFADLEQTLQKQFINKTVVVRGYFVANELKFDESGKLDSPAQAGFGASDSRVYITGLHLKPTQLSFEGQRAFPIFDNKS